MIGRPFSFGCVQDGRRQVFHGLMDGAAVEHLATLFTVGPAEDVVIDLTDVDFMGSVAIGALAKAQHRATGLGCDLRLVAAEGSIAQRVLAIAFIPHDRVRAVVDHDDRQVET